MYKSQVITLYELINYNILPYYPILKRLVPIRYIKWKKQNTYYFYSASTWVDFLNNYGIEIKYYI